MAAEVKILVEGYTNADSVAERGLEVARPTISLVKDQNLIVVVDPGNLESQDLLVEALAQQNITPDQVNIVCITHSHLDHYRNIGMFKYAKTLEYFGLWDKEYVEDLPQYLSSHIQVIKTPGHDYTGLSLVVETKEGFVAIVGDIFWREDSPKEPEDDMFASDVKKLAESRKMILNMADFIVPGHGPKFQVKKGLVEIIKDKINGTINHLNKKVAVCQNCNRPIKNENEKCICRPYLCYRCCLCDLDCKVCNCSHKKQYMRWRIK